MKPISPQHIRAHPRSLVKQIRQRLNGNGLARHWGLQTDEGHVKGSAVLLLLTPHRIRPDGPYEPCLLLNKRSRKVLQPGDLCCPGGGVEKMDHWLSPVLRWPLSPLRKWPSWNDWVSMDSQKANGLALMLTTALREAWEEMRLNPLKVTFMGPLPVQKLVMFDRQIYPLVGWVPKDQALVPNWEVARIVHIPLSRMFDARNFGRYRLRFKSRPGEPPDIKDFPCYIHHGNQGNEILWGATFRIAMDFLQLAFGLQLPDLSQSLIIEGHLGKSYLRGAAPRPHT